MKSIQQLAFTGLAIMLVLASCTMEKRVYMSGYHIKWNKGKHDSSQPLLASNDKTKKNQIVKVANSQTANNIIDNSSALAATDGNITASLEKYPMITNKKVISLSKQKNIFNNKTETTSIISKKGDIENEKLVQSDDTLKKRKTLLSTLWTFASLNYLYGDIVSLMDHTLLPQYLAGVVGGLVISQGFLLAAAILVEIPISMILFSRILKGKGNRNANIIAGIIMTVVQLASLFAGSPAMYYVFFSVIEIITTAFITWYAWKKLPKNKKPSVVD